MAHCIEKLPHKECGSSSALQVFEDKPGEYTGYCFACSTFIPSPYGETGEAPAKRLKRATKTPEEVEQEIREISKLPAIALPHRALKKETLEHFNVTVAVSQVDGQSPDVVYFPFKTPTGDLAYKAKLCSVKKIWAIGPFKEVVDPFGWEQAIRSGAKKLFITEGEEDALALYQAITEGQIGTKWEGKLTPAVVSLTSGAGSVKKNLNDKLHEIRSIFKEVIFVFDMDEEGRKAVKEGLQIYPLARTASLPEKDANDCVIKGHSGALANAVLFKAAIPKNTRIINSSTLYDAARQQAAYGLSYPWAGASRLTRGMRFGETYYLGAGVKMGKSTIRSAIASHLIKEHGLKVFMAAPEETNRKTRQLVASQMVGKIFHDPEVEFDYAAYDEAHKQIGENLLLLNLYQHMGWDSLRADIMAAAGDGAKAIFIDPITNLTNGVPSGEANTVLQEIAQELASIALDMQLIMWIFCHLKSPDSGDSHERGGKVLSHQFAGSRAMMRSCHMMVGLEGNKDPDLPSLVRNQRRLVILEDREFGASGIVNLWYNNDTGLYSEMEKEDELE